MKQSSMLWLVPGHGSFLHTVYYQYQCITVRQRTARYPFVHYSALFLCTLSVFHCGIVLFCVVIFPCCTFFRVAFILCVTLFHVALLHVALFSFCVFLLLHSSHVAIFFCCTLFMLHYFQRCIQDSQKHLRCRAYCCKASHFRCLQGLGYFFHVVLFSGCTLFMLHFFMLHSFHVAFFWYWKILKMNERQKTQPKSHVTLSTVNLFHSYFDIL